MGIMQLATGDDAVAYRVTYLCQLYIDEQPVLNHGKATMAELRDLAALENRMRGGAGKLTWVTYPCEAP